MKAVILAGGLGTRLSEETTLKPKPMVEIGGRPILWHIMKIFSAQGINDFIICCGYKGYVIKEYFANYLLHVSDVTFDIPQNRMNIHQNSADPWRVTLVDTGENSGTGGRLLRVRDYLDDSTFFMTYGDGVANVDTASLLEFHRKQGGKATLTAVQPPGRFGAFKLSADKAKIEKFREKPRGDGAWINGGFFALEPSVLDYVEHEGVFWEAEPLSALAEDGELSAYRHDGFWYAMDTLRDRNVLDQMWTDGDAPWKTWD
ncbi:MAG: glucose-1-phosphate cytidylyltransferase [Gammaproteobacteria bacterium]